MPSRKHSRKAYTKTYKRRGKFALKIWAKSAFVMLCLAALDYLFALNTSETLIIAPFGASVVLVFGVSHSPLAKPFNVIGGHILSALVGVTVYKLSFGHIVFASAFAVSTAIAIMYLTNTMHPPGGATALIAIIGGEHIHQLGYMYVLVPTALGAIVLVLITVFFHKLNEYAHHFRKIT